MNWKRLLKGAGFGVAALIFIVVLVIGYQIFSFNRAVAAVHEIEPPTVAAVADSAALARGEHLATAIGGCIGCHKPGLSGGLVEDMGPVGRFYAPNLTTGVGGVGSAYSDAELARAIRHGIGRDNQTLILMPSGEHAWWSDADLQAVVSFVRSVPPVDNEVPATVVGPLGKILGNIGMLPLLSAHLAAEGPQPGEAPDPEPTARYGEFLALSCETCHGTGFSGGPIPGAPSTMAVPANLTMHETGLAGWTKEDFVHVLNTGERPDGRKLDPFMPIEGTRAMTDLEKTALWEYLNTLEPTHFGNR